MIKYFCDKCSKEIESYRQFKIYLEPPYVTSNCRGSFICCKDCAERIKDFITGKTNG